MSVTVRRVEYFRTEVDDRPGTAYQLLKQLASRGVSLLAISAFPMGVTHTQFTMFPEESETLIKAAEQLNLTLMGPERAILIHGDDQMGALVDYHQKLAAAKVNVFATNGVTDGKGRYGYVIHVRPDDLEAAANALDAD
jgi:hypothetical protein